MKKRFMLVAVLLGSLALASCVDDKESDSVTALRNAVVEKIKANTALTNANVAYKQAEVMYQQAVAEIKANEAELDEATMAQRLEAAKQNAEAELLKAQASYETAKADLVAAMDKEAFAEANRVTTLLDSADVAYNKLTAARQAKLQAEAELLKLQYGLESAQLAAVNQINTQKQTIAVQEALIAEYEKYVSTDKAEAQAAANEARAKAIALEEIKDKKGTDATTANQEQNDLNNLLWSTTFYNCVVGGSGFPNGSAYVTVDTKPLFEGAKAPTGGSWEYSVDITYDDGRVGKWSTWSWVSNYIVDEEKLADDIADKQNDVDVATLTLAEANKALADKKATQAYKDLEKKVADAQKAYDEATTSADKTAKWNALQIAKRYLTNETTTEEVNVTSAEANLETAKTALADIQEIESILTGDYAKEYATLLEKYIEAFKAYAEAGVEYSKADHNYNVQDNLASDLQSVASGITDYEELINECKGKIADANAEIAQLSDILLKETPSSEAYEALIAIEEKKLEKAENAIAIYEPIYNAYVEKINAILAGEE